ncbi:ATP-binding protein [Terrimonas rubra]|uniref:histidine kinase n=1 Tax=Terrimonas rubra TaxID=1035890 RepID=A0ABW5ZZG9_9BACT
MKRFFKLFFPIVILALALMVLIFITQLFTNQANRALRYGNLKAVETFRINNRITELANLAFDLEKKLSSHNLTIDSARFNKLNDSLTILGYNSSALAKAAATPETKVFLNNMNSFIDRQVELSLSILTQSLQASRLNSRRSLIDSLRKMQLSDEIYVNCLEVQKRLDSELENTLRDNNAQASNLSLFNRLLAIAAIIAILVMTTIIIRRHSKQLQLISDFKAAQRAALRSTEVKDQFLANMSHELRTPLNALIGFGRLLSQTPLNETQKQYANVISSSSNNLLNIVNDVLDFSKIEAGKLRIEKRVFNIKQLLQDVALMFSASFKEKGIVYQSNVDEKIPEFIKTDAERLKQILINLIGNALKFTDKGTVTLGVSVVWDNDTERLMKLGFSVSDTGSGIPVDKTESIFKRFEQLEHATTRQHGGTGLGLTIVKSLVSLLGGNVSVYSEMGKGSVFSFSILADKLTPEEHEHVNLNEGNEYTQALADLSGYKLLAVEDNKTNQLLLSHILKKYKANVQYAENGEQALQVLQQQSFDLVLMDIQMPVMDGYVAIGHVRNDMLLDVPVIAMTAYVSADEKNKCLQNGFNGYLAKPLEEYTLITEIQKFLEPENKDLAAGTTNEEEEDYFLNLVGGDMETAKTFINEMLTQWEVDKKTMEMIYKEKEFHLLKPVLHSLRSTFSPLGASHPIYNTISQIDKHFASGNLNGGELKTFIRTIEGYNKDLIKTYLRD